MCTRNTDELEGLRAEKGELLLAKENLENQVNELNHLHELYTELLSDHMQLKEDKRRLLEEFDETVSGLKAEQSELESKLAEVLKAIKRRRATNRRNTRRRDGWGRRWPSCGAIMRD